MENIDSLTKSLKEDKEYISQYYSSVSNDKKAMLSKLSKKYGISNFIKRLFIFDYDEDMFCLFDSIFATIFICFAIFGIVCSLCKVGYNNDSFPIFLLISFIMFLYYIIVSKFQTVITTTLVFLFSVFWINSRVYDVSKAGNYKQKFEKMIVDDNMTKNEFFIENLQTYKNNKLKLFKYHD